MADLITAIGFGGAIAVVGLSYTVSKMSKRIDDLERNLTAVFRYAQEFDPRLDEERALLDDLENDRGLFSGMNHLELVRTKRARGERTLYDPIFLPEDR